MQMTWSRLILCIEMEEQGSRWPLGGRAIIIREGREPQVVREWMRSGWGHGMSEESLRSSAKLPKEEEA